MAPKDLTSSLTQWTSLTSPTTSSWGNPTAQQNNALQNHSLQSSSHNNLVAEQNTFQNNIPLQPNLTTNFQNISNQNLLTNTNSQYSNVGTQNFVQMQPPNVPNMSYNRFQNPQNWPNNQWSTNKQLNTSQNGGNWSALDSLLPTVQQQKTTINQMLPQKQPLLGNNQEKGSKLTNEDIIDFLR